MIIYDWLRTDKLGTWRILIFLTGDLEDGVIFEIIENVIRLYGRYPDLIKIAHDLAEKEVFGDLEDLDGF